MHLKALSIKNFRALEDISTEFDELVSVVVGPNAIGKTTVLEAIRLAKALLAPRTGGETNQMLVWLGASSPHTPQFVAFDAIARDPSKSVEIRCRYELSVDEVSRVKSSISEIAMTMVQGQLGQTFGNPAAMIQFLSSDDGQETLRHAEKQLEQRAAQLEAEPHCLLELIIEPQGNARGTDVFGQTIISLVDRWQPPDKTTFSYFPADRSLPPGEIPVQFGGADAAQQNESHNSVPQNKYTRLKNTIFGIIIQSNEGRTELQLEFERIFDTVLKGRRLEAVGLSDRGLLSIRVADTATGQTFDIDSMSSGEKGLILTFLLISRSMARDGMLLLDEPELHLNPAVCKSLLGFLVDQYARPNNLQAIICTHSPEILAGALNRDDCALYHLRSEKSITKLRIRDEDEVASALQRLGSSQSESLLYRGTIFVEGPDDIDTLENGFEQLLRRYKLKDLGGRREVEKQIDRLQRAEQNGDEFSPAVFVFDQDDAPTTLTSSNRVKILQWRRRMLENYLLDIDALADLLTDQDVVKTTLENYGEVAKLVRKLADAQLDDTAVRTVYESRQYRNPGLRISEIQGKTIAESADILFIQLDAMRTELDAMVNSDWKAQFIAEVEARRSELQNAWDAKWFELCDGKRLFGDLQRTVSPKMSLQRFKRLVVRRMEVNNAESWSLMLGLLSSVLN